MKNTTSDKQQQMTYYIVSLFIKQKLSKNANAMCENFRTCLIL